MLCRLAALARAIGRRLLISYVVMVPVVATGAALWFALPYLAYVGIDFDPLELKKLGKQGVIAIAGMWLVLGLSTWLRMRQDLDLAKWLKETRKSSPIAASMYITGSFMMLVWFVGTVLTS